MDGVEKERPNPHPNFVTMSRTTTIAALHTQFAAEVSLIPNLDPLSQSAQILKELAALRRSIEARFKLVDEQLIAIRTASKIK